MKKLIALLLVFVMALSLCGCGKMGSYKEACSLMESGDYQKALSIFTELGEYKESAQMVTACEYGIACTLLESGDYEAAMEAFVKLGKYEDSAEKVLECRYQMAVSSFDLEDYAAALDLFTELGDYKDSAAYRSDSAWKALHAYIEENGEDRGDTVMLQYVHKASGMQNIVTFLATVATNPEQLILYNGSSINVMGVVTLSDLAITVTRGSQDAIIRTSFNMTMAGYDTESTSSGDGVLNIASATETTQLALNNYTYFYTDIYGKSHTETSMDSTDRASLQESYTYILSGIPMILEETGLGITMADLGFSALG